LVAVWLGPRVVDAAGGGVVVEPLRGLAGSADASTTMHRNVNGSSKRRVFI
jgi:hypothetical protein